MTTPSRAAAEFVAGLDAAALPPRVRDRAGLVLADTIGAIVGGSIDPAVESLASTWSLAGVEGGDLATVFGSADRRTIPAMAAFLNGTAGTVLELDEGHRFAAGHPAIHVVPAVLAEAESRDSTRGDLIVALVAGYEVAVRTARAIVPLAEGYHPHGVWGGVGGAAGVASLRGCDPETTAHATAIAANYAQHTLFAAATEGATVRNSYAGASNLATIVAVDQAEAGFTGVEDGVARHLERAAGDGVDRTELAAEFGDRWEIERGYFKRHAACRYTHAPLDAILALQTGGGIEPDAVERVLVETYPAAAALDEAAPRNSLQAKFSVPFAVATAIVHGESDPPAFADDAIDDRTRSLAARVEVSVADDVAARAPAQRGARVTVEFGDRSRQETVLAPRGGEHDPFTEDELREKFRELVGPVLGDTRSGDLWTAARVGGTPRELCSGASGSPP
jgi:2-methylcitrate dehydratase PrpD